MISRKYILILFATVLIISLTPFKSLGNTQFVSPNNGKLPVHINRDWTAKKSQLTLNNQPLTISDNQLEQQAQKLYETGKFSEAITLLQSALKNYTNQGDILAQITTSRNLALVHQKLGNWDEANQAINSTINLLLKIAKTNDYQKLLAQTLDVQGQIQLSLGNSENALEIWKKSSNSYQQIADTIGVTRSQINQTQALQRLGLYREAINKLKEININLSKQPDSAIKVKGLQRLGDYLRAAGDLKQSQSVLNQTLVISDKIGNRADIASIYISLGNTARFQKELDNALKFYQNAATIAPSPDVTTQAQVNQLGILVAQKKWSEIELLLPLIQANLNQLPISRTAINARIYLANILIKIENREKFLSNTIVNQSQIANYLAIALQQAETLGDQRILSYALGNLGNLYAENQQWEYAYKLTNKALIIAQYINAPDIAYRWKWQLGKILKQQGNTEQAIAFYNAAIDDLKSLRSDLVAMNSDIQFSFRESVEPVYREFAGLLLTPGEKELKQANLIKAREIIESLQLAELDNFFRNACLDTKPVEIDQLDPTAAILYPIILSDRLEVITALPGQPLRRYTTNLPQQEIEKTVQEMISAVTQIPHPKKHIAPSQKLYNWLIAPIEAELDKNNIKTLVFIMDGKLRKISVASLYNGKQYLAEKYNLAFAPSLQLIDPQPFKREKLHVLSAGVSLAQDNFPALPGVELELASINTIFPSETLLNDAFTESNLNKKIKSFPYQIVHLATHGEFSSNAENTFILSWNERINIDQIDSLLRTDRQQKHQIELLILSACNTAVGDKRAALGITGVALRAGARSIIASLWSVSDEATTLLMKNFYQELANSPKISKAEALRNAQLSVLQNKEFAHPYYWSGFVLVGNWL